MEGNLATPPVAEPPAPDFPPSNWGPKGAVIGAFLAIFVGLILGLPAIFFVDAENELTTAGNVVAQVGLVLGFLLVPLALARSRGSKSLGESLRRLGVRAFRPSAFKWMAAAVGAYLLFAILYSALIFEPEQEDIASGFGPVPVQIALIVFGAAIAEEVAFRGMLFGGLRERLPRIPAALAAGVVFGLLHAFTGISAVPPLIALGFVFCLLYEKTGSIVPGILLHMLNNSVALAAQ
ncbi:MAG TPA: type II CAAX endopeptidase family protein [Solirubrobacterales bacterium]|nr:type II CAAX endopeptidase family protein [Solirubrobacterales bacterium]